VTLRSQIALLVFLLSAGALADGCSELVVHVGSNASSGSGGPRVTRETLLREMALLYSNALQSPALMPAFEMRLQEMCAIESQSPETLYAEIEVRAASLNGRTDFTEEREQRIQRMDSQLRLSLDPYLDRICPEHRVIIEKELILSGRVNPLSTGDVEFQFQADHRFVMGHEGINGASQGALRQVILGPADSFAMGQVPVTQLLYFLAALGVDGVNPTPSEFRKGEGSVLLRLGSDEYALRPNHPVENVSYDDAEAHADRVSKLLGVQYSLPSESRWEFANRAGSSGLYQFGDEDSFLPWYGWFEENSQGQTQAVGQLLPNGFHLYDTHGNVWEWTSSPIGPDLILRGGAWSNDARLLRSAYRSYGGPGRRKGHIGFRLERKLSDGRHPAHTFIIGEPGPGSQSSSVLKDLYQGLRSRLSALRRKEK
jgi:hypothetical protein